MNNISAHFEGRLGKDSSLSPSPLTRWLNPTLLRAEKGALEFSYVVREEMTNPLKIIHGGVTAAIIDDALGVTIFSLGGSHLYTTINLAVDYFSTAKTGDTIVAKTTVVKKGNKIMNAQCEVWNADQNRMIARGYSNLMKTSMKAIDIN